jgi:predicted permease
MFQDLKHALRMLLEAKAWTAVVLLSLALGIGANTTLFTAVNGLLLRTVGVPHPEQLVRLRYAGKNDMRRSSNGYGFSGKNAAGEDVRESVSYPVYEALRSANRTLTDIAASAPIGNVNVRVDGKAELASAILVSGNYFQVLDVPAQAGRTITAEDDNLSSSSGVVAVISYGYWQKRFGGAANIFGKTVTVNTTPVTIVGATPPQFTGIQSLNSEARDITIPLAFDPQFGGQSNGPGAPARMKDGTWWWLQLMGRLKPGANLQQVRGNLEGTFQAASREGWASYFSSLTAEQRGLARNQNRTAVPHLQVDAGSRGIYDIDTNTLRSASILSVVVGLMLVIVCANVANLLLSRAAARQKEIAVRLSLGATRYRLVRQLLTESLMLSFIGGGLGTLVAYWSRQLLPFAQTAPLDWRVLGFVALICLLTGVAFGIAPALRATRVDLSGSMKEASRNISRSRTLLTKALLVAQISISLVVLIGAGLFLQTLRNLRNVDAGFNTRNLVVFGVNTRVNGYEGPRVAAINDQIHQKVASLPGIRSVSHSQSAFLSGNENTTNMFIHGRESSGPAPGGGFETWRMTVSPEFFETLEIPLVRGRGIDVRDTAPKAPAVAVINEAAALKFFPGEDPVGKRFGQTLEQSGDIEIVGIVRDSRYNSLRDAPPPTAFLPYAQQSTFGAVFEVRTAGDPAPFMKTIRDTLQGVDPNLPVVRMTTQSDLIEDRFAQERFFAVAYTLFGGLALLLASIGLFGLMSYSVARRTNEIGIRMALGAQKRQVIGMVLGESIWMVSIGIVIGIAATLAAGRLVKTLLYGLQPTDGLTIGAAIAAMIVVSILAAYLPARRASRVDPMTALHYE